MNERQIECFLAAAREGSFSRAARALYITQPAMTHQIGALEAELGVRLFERGASRTTLTPAGRALLPEAQRVAEAMSAMRKRAGMCANPSRPLVLGCPDIMLAANQDAFFEIVRRVKEPPDGIELESRVIDRPPRHAAQLERGEVDLLMSDIDLPELAGERFVRRPLFESGVFVCVHRDHPLAARSQLTLEALDEQVIYWYREQTAFLARLRGELAARGVRHVSREKDSFMQALPFLTGETGVTFFTCRMDVSAPVSYVPLTLSRPIRIGAVYLAERRDAGLARLVRTVCALPKGMWRNDAPHAPAQNALES